MLECVPAELGRRVTDEVGIPTIGIGAGPHTDGQVLVLQDLLGLPAPTYRHHQLLTGPDGRRYAKRDNAQTLRELRAAGTTA